MDDLLLVLILRIRVVLQICASHRLEECPQFVVEEVIPRALDVRDQIARIAHSPIQTDRCQALREVTPCLLDSHQSFTHLIQPTPSPITQVAQWVR